jgi:hypothetical protein
MSKKNPPVQLSLVNQSGGATIQVRAVKPTHFSAQTIE